MVRNRWNTRRFWENFGVFASEFFDLALSLRVTDEDGIDITPLLEIMPEDPPDPPFILYKWRSDLIDIAPFYDLAKRHGLRFIGDGVELPDHKDDFPVADAQWQPPRRWS